jgi:mannosyltransferase OCH1-like enzyme
MQQCIPRVVHQIWMQGKTVIPEKYTEARKSWTLHNPELTLQLWDEVDLQSLVKGTHWVSVLNLCEKLIQRADVYRCAILEFQGGIYVDMDMHSLKSLEPLLQDLDSLEQDIALGYTSFQNTPLHSALACNNAWISSKPNSKVWKEKVYPELLKRMHTRTLLDFLSPAWSILRTAGPAAWTSLTQRYPTNIHALPREFFYSLKVIKGHSELSPHDTTLLKHLSYCYHMQSTSWLKSWESFLVYCFIGNNWKVTVGVLSLLVVWMVAKSSNILRGLLNNKVP